jgi:hypothetical protein
MDASQTLVVLILGSLMGLLGQGSRAVAGLKSMADDAKTLGVSSTDLFQAARLFVSLVIGVLVGLAAALIYLMGGGSAQPDWHILLGFAAAGYTGTDFLEAFISKYLAPAVGPAAVPGAASGAAPVTPTAKAIGAQARPAVAATPTAAPATAKDLVYSVMNELLPSQAIQDSTTLASLGYTDPQSIDIIRGAINSRNWHGVNLPYGALSGCTKISDITAVVTKAIPS